MKKKMLLLVLMISMLALCACRRSEANAERRDIDFTIVERPSVPPELLSIIDSKKMEPFTLTFTDADYLYICEGYGKQSTGGYCIKVDELYQKGKRIYVDNTLIGPESKDYVSKSPSYPFIVIRIEYREYDVEFITK